MITTNLTFFGRRELREAQRLLTAWLDQGLPRGFDDEEVQIFMNRHSGYVFLSNVDFQVAMMNGDHLEIYHTDYETGEEGFAEELSDEALTKLGLKGEGSE